MNNKELKLPLDPAEKTEGGQQRSNQGGVRSKAKRVEGGDRWWRMMKNEEKTSYRPQEDPG